MTGKASGTSVIGAVREPPFLTDSRTSNIAFSMTLLPDVLPVMSIASSIGTPAAIRPEKVREKRARQTFWTMSPIFIGNFSFSRSHCSWPFFDFFQRRKDQTIAHEAPITMYHCLVKRWESITVNL